MKKVRTPVLPAGWAPLSRDEQDAILTACDAAPNSLMFRVGALWNPDAEYRAYRLTTEQWAGLWVATIWARDADGAGDVSGRNVELLGVGPERKPTVQLAIDSFHWDLETQGETWRVAERQASRPGPDPRRV